MIVFKFFILWDRHSPSLNMKFLKSFFVVLLFGLLIGCWTDDPCSDLECGPGECIQGLCDCPDGFIGVNCEIELCYGIPCINGECDHQTKTCICKTNYYGEECNILCANGEFDNGFCHCSVGYEGIACEIESRDRFLGWWGCEEWTWSSKVGELPVQGFLPGSIKFECGNYVPDIELFPTANSSGLMLLSSSKRIVGQVTYNKINFELQNLTTEVTVYGSASLDVDRILSVELYIFNPTTSFTEVAKGTFTLFRHLKDCP